jgi:hypothetical protein
MNDETENDLCFSAPRSSFTVHSCSLAAALLTVFLSILRERFPAVSLSKCSQAKIIFRALLGRIGLSLPDRLIFSLGSVYRALPQHEAV